MNISIHEVLYPAAIRYAKSMKLWQSSGMSRNMSGWYSLEAKQATPATETNGTQSSPNSAGHLQQ
jgi:hypothetical protein